MQQHTIQVFRVAGCEKYSRTPLSITVHDMRCRDVKVARDFASADSVIYVNENIKMR